MIKPIILTVLSTIFLFLAGCNGGGGNSSGGSGMVGGGVGMSPGTEMHRNTSYFANQDGAYGMPDGHYDVSWNCTGTVNLTFQWNDRTMMDYTCVNNSLSTRGFGPGDLTMDFHQGSSINVTIN